MDKLATMRAELERLKGENEELHKELKYLPDGSSFADSTIRINEP